MCIKKTKSQKAQCSLIKGFAYITLAKETVPVFYEIFKDWKIFSRLDMW